MIASQEGSLEIAQALLKGGALPNASTIRGSTALIQACHFGKISVAEELLKNGAMVDQANLKNTTALMRASQEGHRVSNWVNDGFLPCFEPIWFAMHCFCLCLCALQAHHLIFSLNVILYLSGCGEAPALP